MPKIAAFHVIRLNPLVKRQRAWESHVPKKEGPKEMKVLHDWKVVMSVQEELKGG